MTSCFEEHLDLASYALGLLDEAQCAHIEAHLATCDECALELEALLPTVDVLAGVDRVAALAALEHDPVPLPDPDYDVLPLDTGRTRARRRRPGRYPGRVELTARGRGFARPRGRRLAAMLVAAALVIIAGVVLGLLPSDGVPQVGAGPTAGALSPGATVPGIDSPRSRESDNAEGRYFWAVNPTTGTRLDIMLASRQWGTHLSFALSEGKGPLRCRMITIDRRGAVEVVSSWQVPAEGYGTPAHPERLRLQANSSLLPSEISRVDVQALDPAGRPTTLLDLKVP